MTTNLNEPGYYINREISWIRFNERVLEEAMDESHPLLERLKFLCIFSSNLDEFYMIRVAGLKEQTNANIFDQSPDGLSPRVQLNMIAEALRPLVVQQAKHLTDSLTPALAKRNVFIRTFEQITPEQQLELAKYFQEQVYPLLTPLAIDSAHPIPKLRTLGLNLLVELRDPEKNIDDLMAVVPLPNLLPRFYCFKQENRYEFVALEQIVEQYISALFPLMEIRQLSAFRVTRNADLDIAEAEADDLLKLIERELRKRRLGTIVRLEVDERISEDNIAYLKEEFSLEDCDIYRIHGYLGIDACKQIISMVDLPELKDPPFTPALNAELVKENSLFKIIKKKDILLHHPYDSFTHVVELIKEAAKDPQVLAIKQTLYRTSGSSSIVKALKKAAENGKQVTTLIELKARFDEEANIVWARELETAGAHVIYGILGLKTHCKTTLILRQEGEHIQTYVHLSTGNYNEKTAIQYTDFGLLTASPEIGADIGELFNYLTGYSRQESWRHIWVAPINLRENLKKMISACIEKHTPENPSFIQATMNSLVDPEMIRALYQASQNGVKIDLIVRGICCLAPGVPGLSENITVRSIVGRFLEHTRLLRFHFDGKDYLFSGSADWMQRNLNRRVELVYPINDPEVKQQLMDILAAMLKDNVKARYLQPDGHYTRVKPKTKTSAFSAQGFFLSQSRTRQKSIDTILKEARS